jgi:hypothetical protein
VDPVPDPTTEPTEDSIHDPTSDLAQDTVLASGMDGSRMDVTFNPYPAAHLARTHGNVCEFLQFIQRMC